MVFLFEQDKDTKKQEGSPKQKHNTFKIKRIILYRLWIPTL